MKKYYMGVIIGCCPTVIKFKNKKAVKEYLNNFAKKYGSLDDKNDNWIDYIYYGKKLKIELNGIKII